MNIMVYNPSARMGGALSVLHDFYNTIKDDTKCTYYFVTGVPGLEERANIKVVCVPWVNKSWLNRLYFDYVAAPQLVNQFNIDKIISLQNLTIPFTRVPQTLYLQQPLPFTPYKFSFFDNKTLWLYQNVIGKLVLDSVKKASVIYVQSKWMKTACIAKTGIAESKVTVLPPFLDSTTIYDQFIDNEESRRSFFYPSSGLFYKNHNVIVQACLELKEKSIDNYRVFLTLEGNENTHIAKLFNIVKDNNLPIVFLGRISRDQVYAWYKRSTLLFPSFVETYGLPLLEARLHGTPILASSCPFSLEILDKYQGANFFDPFDATHLAELMMNHWKGLGEDPLEKNRQH